MRLTPPHVQTSTLEGYCRKRQMNTPTARHSVSVAGVITDDDGRTLLIRRRDTLHWEPPGGVLELNESIEAGLQREVREETGLTVEPVALTGVYKNMAHGIVALVFRCKVVGGQLRLNDEVSGFQWATPEEVKAMADEAFAVRVLDALTGQPVPAVRQHDGVHIT
jgi:8-oxo-dGTP diphosphatase